MLLREEEMADQGEAGRQKFGQQGRKRKKIRESSYFLQEFRTFIKEKQVEQNRYLKGEAGRNKGEIGRNNGEQGRNEGERCISRVFVGI